MSPESPAPQLPEVTGSLYPGSAALLTPDKPAVIRPATGEELSYRDLEERSRRVAHYLRGAGLRPGDHVAVLSGNDVRMLEVYWGALRSGLYITAVNWHLTADEAAFVITDCGASALFVSAEAAAAVDGALPRTEHRVAYGGAVDGYADYEAVLAAQPDAPLDGQPRGQDMLYSSGTTGRPKGIKPPLPEGEVDEVPDPYTSVFKPVYGFDEDSVYLCPAPLYHAAPLRFCGMVTSIGGTVILMDRFDPVESLRLIERYRVTHSQWVPTMFVRMLKLPDDVRARYDVSSMRCAIHAAAPCPFEIKRRMIEWWGPVINEYYAATEGVGATFIDSAQALAHPGSVGISVLGPARICDDEHRELPAGEIGTVYFERETPAFEYHNDPGKTRATRHPEHENWATTGDIGYLDADGFLYLTDRAAFTIISGGVNVYPQEAENVLTLHPRVLDVAVIGVADDELGEVPLAIVQPMPGERPGPDFADELLGYVRERIAHFKAPRSVVFVDELPRTPTGKLIKHRLRQRFG